MRKHPRRTHALGSAGRRPRFPQHGLSTAPWRAASKVRVSNVDESKFKRGSSLNASFEGGYNVSYFTCRGYKEAFEPLATDGAGDHIVFFGLQYFIKEYLVGPVVTAAKIAEAEEFIARYMADVRIAGPAFAGGWDRTMFPRGDWEAMASGDYECTGVPTPGAVPGALPIKIEALPEGSIVAPGVAFFKLTNTHPRFYWLPNFLETLLVQVWYPTTVATQAREFRKTIQAYSVLSQRVSQVDFLPGERDFTPENIAADDLPVHIAQVFDLLDFGYRGVSSHETAGLGSGAYYTAGFEGSDTVAGSRMLLRHYNAADPKLGGTPVESFRAMFEQLHCATSVPAAEHSTITSWADMSPGADPAKYEADEYAAFVNMIRQYMPSFAVSLVSDGFNIWNAVANLWPSEKVVEGGEAGGLSMRAIIRARLKAGQLTLVRPDSGEGVETLPQLLSLFHATLPEAWESGLSPLRPLFAPTDPRQAEYEAVCESIRKAKGLPAGDNPFRRFVGQQFRILQGDGVALDTVGDMCASILANGFCVNAVHFGSGGGLLQKLNRDSLSVAFKCCAMYVGGRMYAIGKDPIAGGKKSYPGNPPVLRGADGVLRNRGTYDSAGKMLEAQPMSYAEFCSGVEGDVLQPVFENGTVLVDTPWSSIVSRAKVTGLDGTITRALSNLSAKAAFLQRFSSPEALAVRLAEASCGSKWMHCHPTKMAAMQAEPAFAALGLEKSAAKLGLTATLDSHALVAAIKEKHVCDKKAAKKVLAAIAESDMAAAEKAMKGKIMLTL